MAQASPTLADLTANLSDEFLQCSLCFEHYRLPKVLPCQHTFCQECLRSYVAARNFYELLPCPLCKEVFEIPNNRVENFRNNFMIVSLLQFVEQTKKSKEPEKPEASLLSIESENHTSCGACDEKCYLENFCHVCAMWLCGVCSKAHRKVPSTANHPLISNEEVDKQCKELVSKGEERVLEMQTDNTEMEDFLLTLMGQIPDKCDGIKRKIKASAEAAQKIITEKSDKLLQQVDDFYNQREVEVVGNLAKIDEKKKNLEQTIELLNKIKISNDGPLNQNSIKSAESLISINSNRDEPQPLSFQKSVNLAFTPFFSCINELRGSEIGCLRKVSDNADHHFLNERSLVVHKEAALIEREYISALAINKLAHKFVVANNKSVLVLKYNSKEWHNFLSPLSERNVTRPWGIAYSVEDQRVFISEAGTHEGEGAVISYNHDGAFHSVVATGLTLPRGIAVHKHLIFLCDQIDRCVYVMNAWGKVVRVLKKTPDGNFLFNGPMFISVGRSGIFAVSDNCSSVKIFDKDCNLMYTYTSEIADSEFWDVQVLQNDTVIVCDWKHGLHKISADRIDNGLLATDATATLREPSALAALETGNAIYVGTCGGEIFSMI